VTNSAPGDLELVRLFVNTWDTEDGTDAIAEPAGLAAWLAEHGLLEAETRVGAAEHRRAVGLRDALRATLRGHQGGGEQGDPEVIADASQRARLQLRFDAHGNTHLEPSAPGADGALGRLLTIVHEADRDGRWARLKICASESCHWAFYDLSRNRSATWCDMKVCGNRHKVREYRERRLRA